LSLFRYIRKRKYLERISLTPEGFAYLTVLSFIAVGAIVRNVNLLLLMAGIMFAPLFLNWRLAVHRIRSLRGKRQLPKRIHAHELTNVKWICENSLLAVPAINVMVREQIRPVSVDEDQQPPSTQRRLSIFRGGIFHRWFGEIIERMFGRSTGPGKAISRFPRLNPGQTEVQTYQVFFNRRGKYAFKPAELYCSSPFGLIMSRQRVGQADSFFVAPSLGTLKPTWEKRVNSVAKGAESVRRTRAIEEDDFFALRPWRSGDSRKNIHWRSTAKLGSPIVKQFVERNNRDFAIVLDLYDDQSAGLQQACEIILSFATTALLSIGNDVEGRVAVAICGNRSELFRSRTVTGVVSDAMPAFAIAKTSPTPDLVTGIVSCLESVSDTTPIYVVSSRQQPASLKSGLVVEARTDTNGNATGSTDTSEASRRAAERQARYTSRRIRQALPVVRWLDVRSTEFESIFELESIGNSSDRTQDSLKQISKKWLKYAKS
jgi:hypothetical protein